MIDVSNNSYYIIKIKVLEKELYFYNKETHDMMPFTTLTSDINSAYRFKDIPDIDVLKNMFLSDITTYLAKNIDFEYKDIFNEIKNISAENISYNAKFDKLNLEILEVKLNIVDSFKYLVAVN